MSRLWEILKEELTWTIVAFMVSVVMGSIIFWLLWNKLMPIIFGLPKLTFWQAAGLAVLGRCIFNSYGTSAPK